MMDPEDMETLVRHLALQVKQMEEGLLASGVWKRTAVAEGWRWDYTGPIATPMTTENSYYIVNGGWAEKP